MPMEMRRVELETDQAAANLDLQKYNLYDVKTKDFEVREAELERTKVQTDLRQLVANIDGIIVDIKAAEGAWVREGEPVIKIYKLDTLLAQVQIDATRYSQADVDNKQASIRVVLANNKVETFQGTVVFCNPEIEAGQTFNAFIEIQNRQVGNYWLLLPGYVTADITIPL